MPKPKPSAKSHASKKAALPHGRAGAHTRVVRIRLTNDMKLLAERLAGEAGVAASTVLRLAIDEGLPRLEAHLLLSQLHREGKLSAPYAGPAPLQSQNLPHESEPDV